MTTPSTSEHPRSPADQRLRIAIAVWTALAAVAFLLELPAVVRIPLLIGFTLLCPGLAWCRLYPLRDAGDTVAASLGVSIALAAIVGQVMALAKWWSPGAGFAVLAAITAAGLTQTAGTSLSRSLRSIKVSRRIRDT